LAEGRGYIPFIEGYCCSRRNEPVNAKNIARAKEMNRLLNKKRIGGWLAAKTEPTLILIDKAYEIT